LDRLSRYAQQRNDFFLHGTHLRCLYLIEAGETPGFELRPARHASSVLTTRPLAWVREANFPLAKRLQPSEGTSAMGSCARWGRKGRARGGASRPSPSSEVKDGSRNQRERPRVEQRRCLGLGAAARVQSQTKAFEPKPMEDRAAGFWCSEIRERPHGEDPGGGANALVCSLTARFFF
jgi:hypothetical protein